MAKARKSSSTGFIDPALLRQRLVIDTADGPRPLIEAMEGNDWQRRDFEALDPAFRVAMGQSVPGATMRGLLKRGRGHSKTADVGLMSLTALAGSPRQIAAVAVAASKDQARFIRDAIERLVSLNNSLKDLIDVQAYSVVNRVTGSTLDILPAETASSWGLNVHLILCDEICHWPDSREDLWISLLSAANKRKDCALVIITNAFLNAGNGWQWTICDRAKTDPRWYVSTLNGPQATWFTAAQIKELEDFLPPKAFRRLVMNEDIEDAGDYLEIEDINAAIKPELQPLTSKRSGQYSYVCGFDGSYRRDFTALTVLECDHKTQIIRLAEVHLWKPHNGQDIDIEGEVSDTILDVHRRYRPHAVRFDPREMIAVAQKLTRLGVPMIETPSTQANCTRMADVMFSLMKTRRIELFHHQQLIDDLKAIRVVELTNGGFKLDARRTAKGGHADVGFALAYGLLSAFEVLPTRSAGTWQGPVRVDPSQVRQISYGNGRYATPLDHFGFQPPQRSNSPTFF